MKLSETEAAIEAILFSMGEAVAIKKIAEALEMDQEDCKKIILNMQDKYVEEERGIFLIQLEESFQLATKRAYYDVVKRINYKIREFSLTDVLLETLSIIAYQQPITRAHIERVRGVNCNHGVNRLLEYGLICEVGRMDAPGKPILFGTTKDFLRGFGLMSLEELPRVEEETLNSIKNEVEKEVQLTMPIAEETINSEEMDLLDKEI